ncbi:MAG: DUF1571 domain-containing protein [Planctomycetales bacterium]
MISPARWLSCPTRGLLLCGAIWALTCASPSGLNAVDKPVRTRERTTRRTDAKTRKDKADDEKEKSAAEKSTAEKSTTGKSSGSASTEKTTSDSELSPRMQIARRTPQDNKLSIDEEVGTHPLHTPLKLARESRAGLTSLRDYSAVLSKREFLRGRIIEQVMDIQVRETPFSVKLKFQQPYRGREVVYVDGQNRGRLLVRAEGFKALAGTLSFVPTGSEAMAENRHPITEIGIVKMLDITIEQWEKESKLAPNHDVQILNDSKVAQTSCRTIQITRKKSTSDFPYYQSRLHLSVDGNLPVRVEHYDWPNGSSQPQILEDYTYSNIRVNTGLSDRDFR